MDIAPTSKDQKSTIEEALLRSPHDRTLIKKYYEILLDQSEHSLGLIEARLPGIKDSIFLRANTSDISNFGQIFLNEEYGFDFPYPPRRILDLGGYAGYAALYLSRRFPDAEIVSVEPSVENLEIFRLNTARNPRIQAVYGAIWNASGAVAQHGSTDEYWGHRVAQTTSAPTQNSIPAFTVYDIMNRVGWTEIDFVKCDIEGAEVELFDRTTNLSWMESVSIFSVETHDRFRDNSTATVCTALPEDRFNRTISGEFLVFTRRDLNLTNIHPPIIRLTPGNAPSQLCQRVNVPNASWGFMICDNQTFQLHPAATFSPPTTISFPIEFKGHSRVTTTILLGHAESQPVIFAMALFLDGGEAGKVVKGLDKAGSASLELNFQPLHRQGFLILSTVMAEGASSNSFAWARWRNLLVE